MLEIFCVIEDRANDDFLFLLRRDQERWGGIAVDAPPGEPLGASLSRVLSRLDVLRSWPLCDRDPSGGFAVAAPEGDATDRRDPERTAITHVGAQIDGDLGKLVGEGWTVVPFDEGLELVEERDRRVLTLARHGAWIHKVGEIEA